LKDVRYPWFAGSAGVIPCISQQIKTDPDNQDQGQTDDCYLDDLDPGCVIGLFNGELLWEKGFQVMDFLNRMPTNGGNNDKTCHDGCHQQFGLEWFHNMIRQGPFEFRLNQLDPECHAGRFGAVSSDLASLGVDIIGDSTRCHKPDKTLLAVESGWLVGC
jgi:hypothetical protein